MCVCVCVCVCVWNLCALSQHLHIFTPGNVPNPCSFGIILGLPHIGMMGYYCHFQPFSLLKGMASRAKIAILLTVAYLSDDEL